MHLHQHCKEDHSFIVCVKHFKSNFYHIALLNYALLSYLGRAMILISFEKSHQMVRKH